MIANRKTTTLIATTVLLLTPVAAALAQAGPGDAGAAPLPDIKVTGKAVTDELTDDTRSYAATNTSVSTGLRLTPRETPQSVTVITRQQMDDQGLHSLIDVLQQMTGVSSFGLGGGRAASYSWFHARGFSLDNTLLDGVPVPVNLFGDSVDSIAFDSVSLVRGPNGLMMGSGEPSGTIALTRKRPTDSFAGSGSVSLGRWNQYRATVDVGGPLIDSGRVRGRLAAAYNEGKSWLERYNDDETALYGIIEADMGAHSRLSLSVETGRTTGRAGGPYQLATAYADGSALPFARGDNAFADWSVNRERRTTITLGLDHSFNDDWSARVQYIHSQSSSLRKFANVASNPELDGSVDIYGRRLGSDNSPQALAVTLHGNYALWGRKHQVVFGFNGYSNLYKDRPGNVDYTDEGGVPDIFQWQGRLPEPDWDTLADPWDQTRNRTTQYGLFASNRLELHDKLALIIGARLTNWRYSETNMSTGEVTDQRKESSVFTPYLGVVYDLSSALSVYSSYTTIFQPNRDRDQAGRQLDPQNGDTYELGLKGAWFNNRLNASLAVFTTRKENLAVTDGGTTPKGDDSYVALDHARSRGWEMEIAGEPMRGWSLQAGYGQAVIRDKDGKRLLREVPKQTFKLFTSWTPAAMAKLTLGSGVYWQSKLTGDVDPEFLATSEIKSYAVLNLMGRYRFDDKVDLTVNVANLFDRAYRVDPTGQDYGSPRALSATLRYQF